MPGRACPHQFASRSVGPAPGRGSTGGANGTGPPRGCSGSARRIPAGVSSAVAALYA